MSADEQPQAEINSVFACEILRRISKLSSEHEKVTLFAGLDQQRNDVHRLLLAAHSNYFATIFGQKINSATTEITFDAIDGKMLADFVGFLYTGNLDVNRSNVCEYSQIARKYEMRLLQDKCDDVESCEITIANCCDWLIHADMHNLTRLRANAFKMCCLNFASITSGDLCKVDREIFEEIIDADDTRAPEEVIFDRLVQWVASDEMDRSQHVSGLLKCIRLKHIETKVLIEKVDRFCVKHDILDYTKQECFNRLLHTPTDFGHRYVPKKAVYEIGGVERGVFSVRRCNDQTFVWEEVITIPLAAGRKFYGVLLNGTKLYVMGGSRNDDERFPKDIDVFDVETRTRERLPQMYVARDDFRPMMIGHFIYVIGGFNGTSSISCCERFDTREETWQTLASMHIARHAYTATVWDDRIYVAGGYNFEKGFRNSVECYDPKKNEWTTIARVMHIRFEGVLVAWGKSLYAVDVNHVVEHYNPMRNEWEREDIAESNDAMLRVLAHLPIRHNEELRHQVEIKDADFFEKFSVKHLRQPFLGSFTAISSASTSQQSK